MRPDYLPNTAIVQQGGLSGKPIYEASNTVLCILYEQLQGRVPIIASGGIYNKDAALEMMLGANLIQLYTGFVYKGPKLISDILQTLRANAHPLNNRKLMSMAFYNAEQQAQIRGMVLQYISEQSGLDVAEEYAIIEKFLLSYADSPETFKSYRREVERFLQWCYLEQKCLMAAVDRTLFADYLQYAFSPPAEVIGKKYHLGLYRKRIN